MPREEDEFGLRYYNSNTCWIDIDKLLTLFHLTRETLTNQEDVMAAIRAMATRVPTYSTIKDVKKRWGHGHDLAFQGSLPVRFRSGDKESRDGMRIKGREARDAFEDKAVDKEHLQEVRCMYQELFS